MAFLNYEEELAKFEPSKDIGKLDKIIQDRNQKDAADILLELLEQQKKKQQEEG